MTGPADAVLERVSAGLFCSCERPSIFNDVVDGKLCMNCGRVPAPVETPAPNKIACGPVVIRAKRRPSELRRWTPEDIEALKRGCGLVGVDELARSLNRTVNSAKNKAVELRLSYATSASNRHGPHLYWTEERVLEALKKFISETKGELPTSDDIYMPLQKGRMDLPCAVYVTRYFRSFPIAWRMAGAPKQRLNFTSAKWTEADVDYLTEKAGVMPLTSIAHHLGRTYQAVRAKIGGKGLKITARANQGCLSASLMAKEFNTPYHRVCQLLHDGRLPGFYNKARHCWQVDPGELTDEHKALLAKPRRTHQNGPLDRGDYYKRHGLVRKIVDGKTVRVKEA